MTGIIKGQDMRRGTASNLVLAGCCSVVFLGATPAAHALQLYSGNAGGQELDINLDTTAEYSNIFRVNSPSAIIMQNANQNDGDSNFKHGLVDNTFEVSPIFDLKWGTWGLHVSGEAYLDTPYLQKNQNNTPSTLNSFSQGAGNNRSFTSATRNAQGQNAVLLDAFISKGFDWDNGNQALTIKFGRQTLLWGQSLLLPADGIAGGQAPIDINTAQTIPGALAQQVFLPVGQGVLTYQINQHITLQGYYQFEYQPDTFEASGSYFSGNDWFDKGGQILFGPGNTPVFRVKDNRPTHNGQFGIAALLSLGDYDVGLYALRFDDKAPNFYINLGKSGLNYNLVYARDIATYGASVSTTIGSANVAGEISGRTNMPLVSNPVLNLGGGNENSNPLYAVGNTINAQASEIYISPGIPLDPGGVSIVSEFDWNHVVNVTRSASDIAPGRTASAAAFTVIVTPTYYNVLPNVELAFPIVFNYGLLGNSQLDVNQNHGCGSLSLGVKATYRQTWTAGITYQDYLGRPEEYNTAAGSAIFNALADRGWVGFNIEHTF